LKAISIPEFSAPLAYFLGLLLGDGSVSFHKPTITLTFHEVDEKEFCRLVVMPLIRDLFGISPNVYKVKGRHALRIMFDSRKLVNFLVQNVGFPFGKNLKRLPRSIVTARPEMQMAFVRGLFDADGSIIFSKTYSQSIYPSIELKSTSREVLEGVEVILRHRRFRVSLGRSVESFVLRMNGREMLDQWFRIVGSENIKHISRYQVFKKLGYCPPKTTVPERLAILEATMPDSTSLTESEANSKSLSALGFRPSLVPG